MNLSQTGPGSWILLASLCGAGSLFARPAPVQFLAREGFTTAGACRWSCEVSPYLYLPVVDANIGLNHPPEFDICVNQPRPTVSHLLTKLYGEAALPTTRPVPRPNLLEARSAESPSPAISCSHGSASGPHTIRHPTGASVWTWLRPGWAPMAAWFCGTDALGVLTSSPGGLT
jgi:hypothetical protein